jgi:hypothetical protein
MVVKRVFVPEELADELRSHFQHVSRLFLLVASP